MRVWGNLNQRKARKKHSFLKKRQTTQNTVVNINENMLVITRYQVKGVSWIENKRESGIPETLT